MIRRSPSPVTDNITPVIPWTFTDGRGREHAARDLSRAELLTWSARFAWASHMSSYHCERMRHRLIRRLFPWRPLYWWSGDPVARLWKLRPLEQCLALADLFRRAGIAVPPFTPERTLP